jgi:putative ABC transport system permease protein
MDRRWSAWFRDLFRRAQVENDLAAEIDAHVQLLADENVANGMPPEAARRQALVDVGGVEQVKTEVREARTGIWLEQLGQDLRYGVRLLRRSPGFAAMAIFTLALGIGANTAMFSVIDAVLLQSPPFADPARVTVVYQKQPNGKTNLFSTPDYLGWKRQAGPLDQMAAFVGDSHVLGSKDGLERIGGYRGSAEMFSVLGVSPAIGRAFTPEEDRPGAGDFVLLSNELWRTHFQSDRGILGGKIEFDGVPYTVLGVMPPGFFIFDPSERFWRPLQLQTQDAAASSRTVHWLLTMVRLDNRTSIKRAQAGLDAVTARLHREDPNGDAGFGVFLQSYSDATTDGLRQPLLLLMGCVGFVLLIACSNVANLLLARGTARRLEMSIRAAIGAQRSRVVRQLLTESVLLSLIGGALGLLLARGAFKIMVTSTALGLPNQQSISLNLTVLSFTVAICLAVGILFGVAPAISASRIDASSALREAGRGGGRTSGRYRAILVTLETALATVLLIGAGLSLKSLWKVAQVDPGFNPRGVLAFSVSAPVTTDEPPYLFYHRVEERIRALPGVKVAAIARDIPLSGRDPSMPVGADGKPAQVTDGQIVTRYRVIGPDYFHAYQTPLLHGREFTSSDSASSPPVAVISQSLAQRYWPNQDPLGHTLKPNIADAPWYTVIGVAADVRQLGLDIPVEPTAYYHYAQTPKSVTPILEKTLTFILRSDNPAALMDAVPHAVAEISKVSPAFNVKTVEQMLVEAGAQRRFNMWLFGAFGGLALALAAVGVYGVMAYAVSQRTREIGIRMALGASRGNILRVIVAYGMKMGLAGVAVGAAGAIALTRLMAALLYEVSPTDVWTFVLVSAVVVAFILLACYVPSLRATRVDPNVALRYE